MSPAVPGYPRKRNELSLPKPAPKDRGAAKDEARRLIASSNALHVRLAICLMLATAGHVGAILGLTWDRVDTERAGIDLRADATGPC